MAKLDWSKDLKHLYAPSAKTPVMVDVPPMNYLMLNGHGDPNNNPYYRDVVEALFSLAYTIKFMVKKGGVEYAVYPSEGLWWVPDMRQFTVDDKSAWDWTMMIAQPEGVNTDIVEEGRRQAIKKKGLALLEQVRFETYYEGRAAQIMHLGPYSAEGPTIARLHEFIAEQGYALSGKHHEIYLSDVRRAAPEKMRTVIRQPVGEK